MGGPIVLAETIAVTEVYILYKQNYKGRVRAPVLQHRGRSLFQRLRLPAVQCGRSAHDERGLARSGRRDRGGFYLLGIVPLTGLTLTDLHVIGKRRGNRRMAIHAGFVALSDLGHIAMVFGMLHPTVLMASAARDAHALGLKRTPQPLVDDAICIEPARDQFAAPGSRRAGDIEQVIGRGIGAVRGRGGSRVHADGGDARAVWAG
jgi:hypothetical protein